MDNWTDEIDVEYRIHVHQMECQRNGQKAEAIDSSHGGKVGRVQIVFVGVRTSLTSKATAALPK